MILHVDKESMLEYLQYVRTRVKPRTRALLVNAGEERSLCPLFAHASHLPGIPGNSVSSMSL